MIEIFLRFSMTRIWRCWQKYRNLYISISNINLFQWILILFWIKRTSLHRWLIVICRLIIFRVLIRRIVMNIKSIWNNINRMWKWLEIIINKGLCRMYYYCLYFRIKVRRIDSQKYQIYLHLIGNWKCRRLVK